MVVRNGLSTMSLFDDNRVLTAFPTERVGLHAPLDTRANGSCDADGNLGLKQEMPQCDVGLLNWRQLWQQYVYHSSLRPVSS
jgi:hypothetical protein